MNESISQWLPSRQTTSTGARFSNRRHFVNDFYSPPNTYVSVGVYGFSDTKLEKETLHVAIADDEDQRQKKHEADGVRRAFITNMDRSAAYFFNRKKQNPPAIQCGKRHRV